MSVQSAQPTDNTSSRQFLSLQWRRAKQNWVQISTRNWLTSVIKLRMTMKKPLTISLKLPSTSLRRTRRSHLSPSSTHSSSLVSRNMWLVKPVGSPMKLWVGQKGHTNKRFNLSRLHPPKIRLRSSSHVLTRKKTARHSHARSRHLSHLHSERLCLRSRSSLSRVRKRASIRTTWWG